MTVNRQEFLHRSIEGKKLHREDFFPPGWFYHLNDDPFWIYCQHHVSDEKEVE